MVRQKWFSGLSAGLLCLGAALSVIGVEDACSSGVWPQWRGSQRNGVVTGAAWPENLDSAGLQLMWRQEIGEGYPGPIVSTNRVFTVETRAKKQEVVRAFDRISGRQLWETSWEGAMKVPFFSAKNGSWVRSTPAYDGESLYVAGMCDVLVCIDTADGQIRWKSDFAERNGTPVPSFGFVCSPLVVEGFKLLDRRKIADQDTWGHIAVAGDQLFIRELKAISAYRWHGKE